MTANSPPSSSPKTVPSRAVHPSPLTRLLSEDGASDHGTFSNSPSRPGSPASARGHKPTFSGSWLKRAATTTERAHEAGVKWPWVSYLSYYVPCIAWVGSYEWGFLLGDVVAGISMASFYIPMALSLAGNLAGLPPIHGLYAFAIQPLVYALLGSCPSMVVGPEAPGSLLMGAAIRQMSLHHSPVFDDENGEEDPAVNARLAGIITATAGAIAFVAGGLRLGFLDSVLSRPLLRGFISGVGFVIFVDQLIPEMGLFERAKDLGVTRASTWTKFMFLCQNVHDAHALTFAVAGVSFAIIMIARESKKRLQHRSPWLAYIPDRFIVVLFSAVFAYAFSWDKQGLEVLGEVETSEGGIFSVKFPFDLQHVTHVQETLSTAFLIAVLGFFESVVAAKSLGTTLDISISSNRELIALGTANILGGCFQSLPAFGGYGRSKVNKSTGGRTPLSSVVLSALTFLSIIFLLPYFFFIPKAVLCAMISVVAVSLLEEAPHDIAFFVKIRAYSDLATMALVFFVTIFWNLATGIAIGVGVSLIQVIRNSTVSRIQILGRLPGTAQFLPVEEDSEDQLEPTGGILVVKIRERLTFANAGDMSRRLWRIERYGDSRAHPSLPRLQAIRVVVFDVAGMTTIDGSGSQVLKETVENYVRRGKKIWFARVPGGVDGAVAERIREAGIIDVLDGRGGFVASVDEGVRHAEAEQDGEVGA